MPVDVGAIWNAISPVVYVVLGGAIGFLTTRYQLKADQRSRYHDDILSRVAEALDVYRTLEALKRLPGDDQVTAQRKEIARLQQFGRIRKVKDELSIICLSADLPIAVDRAFSAYMGQADAGLMPPLDEEKLSKMGRDVFDAHDKVLREAHHELGISLERQYARYPRGIVVGDPQLKKWWQVWRKK